MSASGHILIIDDEASLRQTLARILQRAGFEVTTAINGTEGFSLVSQHLFDMVYLDIRMPDVSGLELLKSIHAEVPGPAGHFVHRPTRPEFGGGGVEKRGNRLSLEAAQASGCGRPHEFCFGKPTQRTAQARTAKAN